MTPPIPWPRRSAMCECCLLRPAVHPLNVGGVIFLICEDCVARPAAVVA